MKKKALSVPKLPRIACVGAEAITSSHGTGMMFSRHFSKYPHSLVTDCHYQTSSNQYFFQKVFVPRYDLNYAEWKAPWLKRINSSIQGDKKSHGTSLIYRRFNFEPIDVNWKKLGGSPDLIYSTCYSAEDFAFLHHFYRSLSKKVPIVQHFLDLDFTNYDDMVGLYRELAPAIVAKWALTIPISYAVEKFSMMKPELVQALQQPITQGFKRSYRKFSKNFKPVIIGNVWSASAFRSLAKIWQECQTRVEALPALSWYGQPRRFKELEYMKVEVKVTPSGPVIRDGGFLSNSGLKECLRESDIAIVAFTGDVDDKPNYSTYSFPSRIGDYCVNGLPIVLISLPGTEVARVIEEAKMGIVIDPTDPKQAARKLSHFIYDQEWRDECGKNARKFAETHLNLDTYQKQLYPRLAELAKHEIPVAHLKSRFSIK